MHIAARSSFGGGGWFLDFSAAPSVPLLPAAMHMHHIELIATASAMQQGKRNLPLEINCTSGEPKGNVAVSVIEVLGLYNSVVSTLLLVDFILTKIFFLRRRIVGYYLNQ